MRVFFVFIYIITVFTIGSVNKQLFFKVNFQSPRASFKQDFLVLNHFVKFLFITVFFFFLSDFLFRNLYQPYLLEFSLLTIVLVSISINISMRNSERILATKIK